MNVYFTAQCPSCGNDALWTQVKNGDGLCTRIDDFTMLCPCDTL